MIEERYYPNSMEDLMRTIVRFVDRASSVAIQAGHFLVYYDHTEDIVLPCVRQELKSSRHAVIADKVGVFPFLTWQLGLEFLKEISASSKSILTVVNDWQYLPEGIDRARFYKQYETLFDSYADVLAKHSEVNLLTQRDLGFKVKTGVWFSEVSLRNQYKRYISKLIKTNSLPSTVEIADNEDTITCSLVDAVGRRQEIYCTAKSPSCAQEIAELVRQICCVGQYDMFVNIFPLVCKEYVHEGTDLAFYISDLGRATIINIGTPSSEIQNRLTLFSNCEISIHRRLNE